MEQQPKTNESRRSFVKKVAFIPPAIMTLTSLPAIASTGSPRFRKERVKDQFEGKKDEFSKASFDKKGGRGGKGGGDIKSFSKGGNDKGGKSGGKGGGKGGGY